MRESDIERHLRESVTRKGGLALKFISPGRVGVPDRIVLLPPGKIIFVEMKAPGGKLSAPQERTLKMLESLGFFVRMIDSFEGVDALIAEFAA